MEQFFFAEHRHRIKFYGTIFHRLKIGFCRVFQMKVARGQGWCRRRCSSVFFLLLTLDNQTSWKIHTSMRRGRSNSDSWLTLPPWAGGGTSLGSGSKAQPGREKVACIKLCLGLKLQGLAGLTGLKMFEMTHPYMLEAFPKSPSTT